MALSHEERRILDQLEAALAIDDPRLDRKLATARRRPLPATLGWALLGFLVGVALLLLGISTVVPVSVLGFVLMLAATITAAHTWCGHYPNQP